MSYLAVSSFSLHSQLGPLHIERRREDGVLEETLFDFPAKLSLEEFVREARDRIGVRAVEMCQVQFDTSDPKRIARLAGTMADVGIRLLTLPIDTGDLGQTNAEWLAEDEARIARWFGIARRLGASYVRVNAGPPGSGVGDDAWNGMVASLGRLGDVAGEMGLRMLVENHGGTSSDPAFLRTLLDAVGKERLGLLLDLGNFDPLVGVSQARFLNGDADDTGLDLEPVYTAIAELAPLADLVHAKSVDPARDGTPLPDLPRALAIVAAAGYDGSVSLEWEGRLGDPWEHTATMASLVRDHFPNLG